MIDDMLKQYNLPFYYKDRTLSSSEIVLEREKMKKAVCEYEYGYFPKAPISSKYSTELVDEHAFGDKGIVEYITVIFEAEKGIGTFKFVLALPKNKTNVPVFVFPNFDRPFPETYLPGNELIDEGFGFATFLYTDVAEDDNDIFKSKLPQLLINKNRNDNDPGAIVIWSWCCMRIADYLQTRKEIDYSNLAIIGHSRLGKTALLTGAFDHRFRFVFPNDSGCSGDALSRAINNNEGEDISFITKTFPYWFAKKYKEFSARENDLPLDQHVLISLVCPNYVCAGTAQEDRWASPDAQYLSYVAASSFYKLNGIEGFVSPDRLPEVGEKFFQGHLGYYRRNGTHYLTREDWHNYIEFFKMHRE